MMGFFVVFYKYVPRSALHFFYKVVYKKILKINENAHRRIIVFNIKSIFRKKIEINLFLTGTMKREVKTDTL